MRKVEASDLKLPTDPAEAEEIMKKEGLDAGLPRLGQYSRLRVNIKESTELKASMQKTYSKISTWLASFSSSFMFCFRHSARSNINASCS